MTIKSVNKIVDEEMEGMYVFLYDELVCMISVLPALVMGARIVAEECE